MKLIAHRGGRSGPENSLEALSAAVRRGADAAECDVRLTQDGIPVIFHDSTLDRLAGICGAVGDHTYCEIRDALAARGRTLLTLDELCRGFHEEKPILLHVKMEKVEHDFAARLAASGLPVIIGCVTEEALSTFAEFYPREQLLAFMPSPDRAMDFFHAGAGILRLWEQWLPKITPAQLKKMCPGAEVFVMASCLDDSSETIPLEAMDGSRESLDKCLSLGADGVLLNDLTMALSWRSEQRA